MVRRVGGCARRARPRGERTLVASRSAEETGVEPARPCGHEFSELGPYH